MAKRTRPDLGHVRGQPTFYVNVNEAWCRADERAKIVRKIVEWLRSDSNGLQNGPGYAGYFAGAIIRKFGDPAQGPGTVGPGLAPPSVAGEEQP